MTDLQEQTADSRGNVPAPVPLATIFRQMKLPEFGLAPPASLHGVEIRSRVIEDYRPLADSIEWRLAAAYWQRTGVSPFVDNSVPHVINNNGRPSERAAAVLLAACDDREAGELPITVIEVGAGSGLFARYFLDAFQLLCTQQERPYYERLRYVVTDRSARSVEQWAARDLFAAHPGRVVLATCDARDPGTLAAPSGEPLSIESPLLIVCNYVLDVLPAAVVRAGAHGPEQLCVRTHISTDGAFVGRATPATIDRVRALATSESSKELDALPWLIDLLELETAWRPVAATDLPHLAEALEAGEGIERILLNHGALDALDRWLERLARGGCLLVRDYGPVERTEIAQHATPQRFGASTAFGLNFPLLEHHVGARGWTVVTPPGDASRSIHVRLIHRDAGATVPAQFTEGFGAAAEEFAEQPLHEALAHMRAGRHEAALECFKTAVERSPRDWFVIGNAAEFVGLHLRDFGSGAELARSAIELNPYYSAWLWNVLGDCLYCAERFDDAHEAYLQAARIDPQDSRTALNLAYTHLDRGDIPAALHAIATGLARDADGAYRERLLDKQQQILAAVSAGTRAERERLLKRALAFT